ncbi:MAG: 6-phosphofructokinase [Lachnospiraceae bacterium]|jgi:6-phosphofructokinase 1|nr:6-phosphofructokinase [Lachnospiraceae bacterium]MEE3460798.1 6-phosphofructokinase [Lachnospiraceae bacterium]
MGNAVQKIGVLTSGGDAPGMNAAIRAVVRTALSYDIQVVGIKRGYAGLLEEDIEEMDSLSVSDIIQLGGTILYTARCPEFKEEATQDKAADILRKLGIEGLVVIGGDGSFMGASALARRGINTIGIPGTIDLDIACTDYTIGFDTAVNTAVEAVDKLRDTSESHERCSVVEVMGHTAGHIALWSGIASGAEYILTTEEYDGDLEKIIKKIILRQRMGKKNHIIVNAEGIGNSTEMAKVIQEVTGIETRATILGHIQRGGSPSGKDRVYASAMGAMAVELLNEGRTNRVVAYRKGEFVDYDIQEALAMQKGLDPYLMHIQSRLTTVD